MRNILIIVGLLFNLISCSAWSPLRDYVPLSDQDLVSGEPGSDVEWIVELDGAYEGMENEQEMLSSDIYDDQNRLTGLKTTSNEILSTVLLDYETYTVKRGDTLGLIAYSIYRDFNKWKDVYKLNEDVLHNMILEEGTVLRYLPPTELAPLPDGSPYLVVRNDTLGRVSGKVYNGATKYWRNIWENNKFQIEDYNLIFPGMVLYYQSLNEMKNGQRRLASYDGV